ncbi:sigma-70 family RNA polymerase sigma factor [Edaphobacter paludis]|uniref:Sigma-70 family RNA polymerase sigma factor n=1 Tax=Edaphobacter paludis TaxID=3035702 RepID=A0AAU7D800_9BACT
MHKTDALAARLSWTGEEDAAMDSTASIAEQEFRSLYDATSRPILAYLIGVTGRRDVAEDVLQETYCRFLVRQPAAMEATEARRYLFRIATNLLRDRWRRGEDATASELVDEGSLPDANMPDVNTQMDVRRAMQMMKPRERELLWLAYVEGMSHAEIAKATGLGTMSVRLLLFRARQRAAALLRPLEDQERKSDESKRV